MHRVSPQATRLRRSWRAGRLLDSTNWALSFRCGEPFLDASTCFVRTATTRTRPTRQGSFDTSLGANHA